jgi:hypothetical protein
MVQISQQILTDLKIRIHERDESLLHYDLRRNKLRSWQEKSQKDPIHHKLKLENVHSHNKKISQLLRPKRSLMQAKKLTKCSTNSLSKKSPNYTKTNIKILNLLSSW